MLDSIYTIPIKDVFEPKDDCPICRLRDTLETRCIDYILGAAMMEPDIRIMTNEQGFCRKHFNMMFKNKNKLSLALILESHLDTIEKDIFSKKDLFNKGAKSEKAAKLSDSCFVCSQIDTALTRMMETVVHMWDSSLDFKELFAEQPVLCLEHYKDLCLVAKRKLNKKRFPDFADACEKLTVNYLTELRCDVTHFTKMFDYRNSGEDADWKNSKDSIQRAIWYLTSYKPE